MITNYFPSVIISTAPGNCSMSFYYDLFSLLFVKHLPGFVLIFLCCQVTLPCRVENKIGIIQWTRDGFGLGDTRDLSGYSRYRLIGSDDESKPGASLTSRLLVGIFGSKFNKLIFDTSLPNLLLSNLTQEEKI